MHNFNRFGLVLALAAVLVAVPAFGQANMQFTTFSAAVNPTQSFVTVASATGITGQGTANQINTVLFSDREAMIVLSVSGTRVNVIRGAFGTRQSGHASGTRVWFGAPHLFAASDPIGPCTATQYLALPLISYPTGNVWYCDNGLWIRTTVTDYDTARYLGTPATGVSAVESGIGKNHVTTLTFTDLALISPVGAANLAGGGLLYTLPTGPVIVKSAYMSVALTGSGANCDADTPDTGVGTVIGSGANALLSADATFENILTGQTSNDVNGTAEVAMVSNQILNIAAADAHTVHLNTADGWAGACNVTGTGTVVIEWVNLR